MPVSKTLAYDAHAYLAPITLAGQTTVGANGVSPKFAAFTALQVRAACVVPNVASVSASQPLMFVKSGTATTTTTLSALTSAAITVQPNLLATSVTLVQGDHVWLTHGTDTAASISFGLECYPTPGAALAAP